jgi:hypothetical protein
MRRCPSFQGAPFIVGGSDMEFVNEWSHLGHIISNRLDDNDDFYSKKNVMIGQINNLCCFSCFYVDHVLKGCAPVYDEIARHDSNFIIDVVSSDSSVVRFMANHSLNSAKARSPTDRNAI